jgi:hypothetical protein
LKDGRAEARPYNRRRQIRLWDLALAGSFVLIVAVTAAAQESPARPDMSPAEIQKIFDGYLVIEAQAALGLSDQQFAQFVPRLRTLQEVRRRHQQERFRLLNDLQRMTRPAAPRGPLSGDEALLKERLSTLQEMDSRFAADLRRAYTTLDEVLDVRQQARFRVFEEQIERKKLELLLRARQNPNRPPAKRH